MAPRDHFGTEGHRSDDAGGRDGASERPFPAETDWLSLPLPPDAAPAGIPAPDFVERVVRAIADDRTVDAELATLARELPRSLFEQWRVPEPSAGFVDRTVAAVQDERRARWQQLLARHVAPEPSPQFVATTLAALRADAPSRGPALRAVPRWRRFAAWPIAAAAAAALWLATSGAPPLPSFEDRLARTASPAYAHAYASTPAAVVLASRDRAAEPDALFDAPADGVWLTLGAER
jgi:hypothetical protein